MSDLDRGIAGQARSVSDLLSNKRYGLEFYQREYAWTRDQVGELVTDLTSRFSEDYDEEHTRRAVADYRQYFLGPIITSDRGGTSFLIDGQQRLTTLTILLIVLLHRLDDEGLSATVRQLIYSEKYGERSLTVDVEEREPAMEALIDGRDFDAASESQSLRNIVARHSDLEELLDIQIEALPLFTEWLLNKVILVEIIAPESDMAYDIFETMNDRGLRLTPTDMLKSYLLASIQDDERIATADDWWRERVKTLEEERSDGDSDFFKAWLRAHYAESIRDRRKGATSEDWDLIGTQFHKWVREKSDSLIGLERPEDFHFFVRRSFDRMSSHFLTLNEASQRVTPGLEHVRYNAALNYSLQLTVALAPVTVEDDDTTARRKMELVARYLNLFIAQRIVNYRNYGYSPTYYTMFVLARRLRHATLDELVQLLREEAGELADEGWQSRGVFGLHLRNRPQVRYLLARITDHVERAVDNEPTFDSLISRDRKDRFEIEHILASHYDRHSDEFEHETDFDEARNRLGDLLLLPKSFNASYGDLPYEEKLVHYRGQNILAATLHPTTYERNPNLRRYIERGEHPFVPHERFGEAAIAQRQELYMSLVREIWDPERLLVSVDDATGRPDVEAASHAG